MGSMAREVGDHHIVEDLNVVLGSRGFILEALEALKVFCLHMAYCKQHTLIFFMDKGPKDQGLFYSVI